MTLNRKQAPDFKTIDKIHIQHAVENTLDNGIKVYTIDSGSQELTKIEFLFKAGMYYQSQPLLASAANNLLETGTKIILLTNCQIILIFLVHSLNVPWSKISLP